MAFNKYFTAFLAMGAFYGLAAYSIITYVPGAKYHDVPTKVVLVDKPDITDTMFDGELREDKIERFNR